MTRDREVLLHQSAALPECVLERDHVRPEWHACRGEGSDTFQPILCDDKEGIVMPGNRVRLAADVRPVLRRVASSEGGDVSSSKRGRRIAYDPAIPQELRDLAARANLPAPSLYAGRCHASEGGVESVSETKSSPAPLPTTGGHGHREDDSQ